MTTRPVRDYSGIVASRLRVLKDRLADGPSPSSAVEPLWMAWESHPRDVDYADPPGAWRVAIEQARTVGGGAAVATLVRHSIAHGVERALDTLPTRIDLAPIHDLFLRAFALILGAVTGGDDSALDPVAHDLIRKDLAVVLLRAWPTGTMLVEPRSVWPRRPFVAHGSVIQRIRGAGALVTLGPNRPYYQQHLYDRFLPQLTPDGWLDCLERTAALLERDPVARGISGGAWFWDPAVELVSPRISFLRALPARHGAVFHPLPEKSDTVSNATINSAERQKAVAEGRYVPTEYALVWPRKAVVAWARNHRMTSA